VGVFIQAFSQKILDGVHFSLLNFGRWIVKVESVGSYHFGDWAARFPMWNGDISISLYLLFSPMGELVFSDRYEEIIHGTPNIKCKTSIIVWIFLFILIGVILAAIIATEVAGR
jgi:peptidoglycan/LPS O-acetylase OafA/YrhL